VLGMKVPFARPLPAEHDASERLDADAETGQAD
jgi:hypothetical protein